jgi:hypothetical protein
MDRISAIFSNVKAENQSEVAIVDKSYDEHIVPSSSDEGYLDDEDDGDDYGYIVYGAEDEPDPDDEIEAD